MSNVDESFISEKVEDVPYVGSRVVSRRLRELERKGMEVFHLSGAPTGLPPAHVLEAADKAARQNINPPSNGIPELREAIARKLNIENKIVVDPERQILVTNGAMHALYVTMTTFLNPGEEVIIFSPGFFFDGIIKLVEGIPVYVPLSEQNEFKFDIEELTKRVNSNTKIILVNTPVNPTGYVFSMNDLMEVAEIARKHDLLVVSDESYEKLVYERRKHHSMASLPGMKERTLTIQSFTKSYSMLAWRVGYIAASKTFIEALRKTLEWMVLCCNYTAQKAATAALTGPQEWVKDITLEFQSHRDTFCRGLAAIERVSYVLPKGGPFVFPNISQLGMNGEEFSSYLLEDFGIPTTPGTAFQSNDHVRIPFGASDQTLKEVLKRIDVAVARVQESSKHGSTPKGKD